MAVKEGVLFAWDVGIGDAIFECDSKTVWDAINRLFEPPVTIANIVLGINKSYRNSEWHHCATLSDKRISLHTFWFSIPKMLIIL